jgi:hypothetical protein
LNWVLADRTRLVKDSSTELAELGLGDILNDLLAYRDGVEDYPRENQRDGDCCLGGGEERGDLLLDSWSSLQPQPQEEEGHQPNLTGRHFVSGDRLRRSYHFTYILL